MAAKIVKPVEMILINDFVFVLLWKDFLLTNPDEPQRFLYI
jgi:hypothetical protein